jgi:hypothetical protein
MDQAVDSTEFPVDVSMAFSIALLSQTSTTALGMPRPSATPVTSGAMSHRATLRPSATNASALARPIPDAAPVTITPLTWASLVAPELLAHRNRESGCVTLRIARSAAAARARIRTGEHLGPTSGLAPGFAQANLVVLPDDYALDFLRFLPVRPSTTCDQGRGLAIAGAAVTRCHRDRIERTRARPEPVPADRPPDYCRAIAIRKRSSGSM